MIISTSSEVKQISGDKFNLASSRAFTQRSSGQAILANGPFLEACMGRYDGNIRGICSHITHINWLSEASLHMCCNAYSMEKDWYTIDRIAI